MKIGFSACNFPHRNLIENIAFAKDHGFDFVEAYAPHVDQALAEDGGAALTAALKEYGMEMTVHHALPPLDNPEKQEAFRRSVTAIHEWVRRDHPIADLSFDTWVDRLPSLPTVLWVLELFSDTDLPILTEDYPLNDREAKLWEAACRYPNFGLLSDLGHTNVRLGGKEKNMWCLNENEGAPLPPGDNSVEAFRNAYRRKPRRVHQLHLHNNWGEKDDHRSFMDGSADFEAIARMLVEEGFDGYADLELSPTIHGVLGEDADRMLLEDFALWKTWIAAV